MFSMNNLKICLYFAFAAIVLADLQNVIEYEMKKLLKNEQVDVGSWWKKVRKWNDFKIAVSCILQDLK